MKKTIDNIIEKVTKLQLQIITNNAEHKADKIEYFLENFTEQGLYEFAEFIIGLRSQNQPFSLNEVVEGVKMIYETYKKNK